MQAAAAAHAVLVALGTNPAHGMLPSTSEQDAGAAHQHQQRTGSRGKLRPRQYLLAVLHVEACCMLVSSQWVHGESMC